MWWALLTKRVAYCSEITSEGTKENHLDQILLNGNNVAMVRTLLLLPTTVQDTDSISMQHLVAC